MSVASTDIDNLAIDTIRTLSMDAVQTANSGHPGTPMALAPIAYQLFNHTMNYDPAQPLWPNRDRFVLSCGHASMLLYSVLHLAGVKATDKSGNRPMNWPSRSMRSRTFAKSAASVPVIPNTAKQRESKRPPDRLGAGCQQQRRYGDGQKWLAANYNTADHTLFDYNVYALCSDGDLMEGVCLRSGVGRRPPEAGQPVLAVRRQPHHDRRRHRSGVQRRCRPAVRRSRLERVASRRRQ